MLDFFLFISFDIKKIGFPIILEVNIMKDPLQVFCLNISLDITQKLVSPKPSRSRYYDGYITDMVILLSCFATSTMHGSIQGMLLYVNSLTFVFPFLLHYLYLGRERKMKVKLICKLIRPFKYLPAL